MKLKTKSLTLILLGILGLAFGPTLTLAGEKEKDQKQIERGKYLVDFGGCHDCHTPKLFTAQGPHPDMSKALSGHPDSVKVPDLPDGVLGPNKWGAVASNNQTAWQGPWGVSFAANLTPDDKTGIGSWTETQFVKSMRTGKHFGEGRNILPPMPWFSLAILTDEDLNAIFQYLKSLKPIENKVPQPIPPKM